MVEEELSYSADREFYQNDVYKIVSSTDPSDFFLIENRQTGEGWNQALALDGSEDGGGLLIWHIGLGYSSRKDDYIDLIEADGSAFDRRTSYYGDLFPGSTGKTALTDFTTPNSRKWGTDSDPTTPDYHPANPGGNSSVRIFDISSSGTNMTATLSPFWVGSISQGMNDWSGIVTVGGDVTVPSGVTLTLAAGTEVHFLADQDDAMSGSDSGKAELIVDGVLEAGAGNIFRSSNDDPSDPEWYGIYLRGQGQANLTNATLRDGVACVPVSGNGAFTLMGATLADCGLITGYDSVPFPENGTNVATYLTTGRMGSSVSWDLEGDDAYDFNISSGQLSFDMPPDFESPMDDDEKNTYDVIVVARGGQLTATKEVTVTVEDLFEPEVPLPPGDLSAESGWTRVHVEWLPVPMVSGYDVRMQRKFVYYGPPNSWPDEWEVVAENEVGEAAADSRLLYTHSDLNPDYTYRYQVRSRLNEETVSLWSDIFPGGEGVQPRPGAATGLQGEPGSSSVPLRWDRLNLTNITRWEYRAGTQMGTNIEWGPWEDIGGGPGTTEHRVDELVNGTAYTFQVRAFNQAGDGEPSAASEFVTPQLTLIISGTSDTTFVENSQNIVDTYTTTAPVTWSLGGVDADRLSIDADGHLRFPTPPDFEMPTDADGNNIYHVRVRARSGGEIVREESPPVFVKEVTVEVLNADDPGVVALSSTQPEVGEPITATLTDQDGLVEDVDVRWSWLFFSSEDSPRNGEPTVVSSSDEFIPSGVLMGLRLQARALYADGHGTNQSAASVKTEPVVGVPSAPQNLTATPSDGSLVLAWDAPSLVGYPAFSGYRYRYKAKGTGWLPSATGALVDQTTRPTLEEGLIHGKEHTVEVWAVNAQGAGPSATTTATPPSPDTPGRVELTSMRPRVGVPLTATLVDPDAPVQVRRWRWQQSPWYYRSAGDSSLVAPSAARYPELASYEPTVPAIGRRLRAVVDYTDQYGTQSAQSAWTAPVLPGRPGAPALSATAGDGQVALTWTAAADQGAAIVRYQYHRSDKLGKWLDVPGDGLDGHYTVEGLSNDTDYTFKVRAVNQVGEGSPSNAVTATPQGPADPNPHAPVIAGPEEVSVAEGDTGRLADYTTSDGDGDGVTLSLSATDGGPFSLNSSGALQLTSALDYESDRTSYEVTLTATDDGEPSKSSTKQVPVTVDNVDEVGTVTLSDPSPQVGDHLTATLSDPDGGIRNVSWSWQDIPRSDESDDTEPPRTTSYPYTVEASDEGRRIEVRASYTDAHGSGKTARATTEPVQEAAESNPHAPEIEGPEEVSVAEGHTGALADATYTTSDDDGDEMTLTLTDADRGPFSLSSSGTLRVTSALDYERDNTSYTVTLTATDDGEPSKSSTKQVTVTVDNVDEVGTVTLSDPSPQVGDHLTATLSDPDGGIRNVSWSWQDIPRSDESDDAEPPRTTSYPYTVEASDEGRRIEVRASYTDAHGSGKSARATTEVVQEAAESNPHAPEIAGPEEVSVAEGHTGALADATYTTSDGDDDQVTLTLTDADRGPFSLSSSGTLQVTSALDYESDDTRYEVTLEATDDGEPSKSSTKQVTVTVDNVDEVGTVTLSSSSPQVGDHLTATLTDPDGGLRNVSWYWQDIPRSDESDDTEPPRTTSYPYTVEASDEGRRIEVQARYTDAHGSGKTARATTEPVQEAAESNRYEPEIEGPERVSINEGATGSLADYTTSDGDGDEVTLTLTDADRGPFSLSSSGALRVTSALDYESDDTSYTVTLTATDDGTPSKSSTKRVAVSIRNVDEAGTVRLTSSSPQVGDRLTASLSDPDGYQSGGEWDWQLWYRQGDGDDASWVRDESVRYTADSYTVQVSDAGRRLRAVISNYTDGHGSGKSAHSALTEPVEESNRHEPVISGPSSASINEGTTGSLADYTTSDGDGDDVTLTLTNADRGPFSLSSSGALRVTSALDFETRRYELRR